MRHLPIKTEPDFAALYIVGKRIMPTYHLYAEAYECEARISGDKLAVLKFDNSEQGKLESEMLLVRYASYKKLNHPNIPKVYDIYEK